jgi:hypothetical protein
MKKFKSKTKIYLASLLAGIAIVSTPFISSAQGNDQNNYQHNKQPFWHIGFASSSNNSNSNNSIWTRFGNISNLFGNYRAQAQTTVNTNQTPNISGITAPTVLKAGETGTWKVNASDPQNGSLTYAVQWGDEAQDNMRAANAEPIYTQTSTFSHAYTNPGVYTVNFSVSNAQGLKTSSSVTVHITGQAVTKPVVSDFQAVSTLPHHATVSWTTDVAASSLVWYDTKAGVDTNADAKVSVSDNVKNHSLVLNDLTADTTYYIVVGSRNDSGTGMSQELSFKTPVANTTTPVIKSLSGNKTVKVGETETVTIEARDPQNGSLTYSANWGDEASMKSAAMLAPSFTQTATLSHIYSTPGTYTATFTAENNAGYKDTSSMKITVTATDTTGPQFSNLKITPSTNGSTITWTTNENTASKIFYGTTTPVDVNSSSTLRVTDSSSTKNHSMVLSGLQANTLYHFVIQGTDASNNMAQSAEANFTTTS